MELLTRMWSRWEQSGRDHAASHINTKNGHRNRLRRRTDEDFWRRSGLKTRLWKKVNKSRNTSRKKDSSTRHERTPFTISACTWSRARTPRLASSHMGARRLAQQKLQFKMNQIQPVMEGDVRKRQNSSQYRSTDTRRRVFRWNTVGAGSKRKTQSKVNRLSGVRLILLRSIASMPISSKNNFIFIIFWFFDWFDWNKDTISAWVKYRLQHWPFNGNLSPIENIIPEFIWTFPTWKMNVISFSAFKFLLELLYFND